VHTLHDVPAFRLPPEPEPPPPGSPVLETDLGFGAVVARESRRRLLNPDGSFNVAREGLRPFERFAPYHAFLAMSWPRFLAYISGFYVLVNVVFGAAFWACGPDALVDAARTVPAGAWRAFFFSVETFATVGYGSIVPFGLVPNLLMTLESLVGLLSAAIVTGLVFARFSRPTARVRFSRRAVLAPYGAGQALMFRLANERRSELVQLEARVLFSHMVVDAAGRRTRRFDELPLERQRVVFFPLAWTIVHPIDASSPLHGLTAQALEAREAELLVLLSGIDETASSVVHARTSYKPADIVGTARFASVFLPPRDDGTLRIDIARLDEIERL
jgi:inward rectifier potassium channel